MRKMIRPRHAVTKRHQHLCFFATLIFCISLLACFVSIVNCSPRWTTNDYVAKTKLRNVLRRKLYGMTARDIFDQSQIITEKVLDSQVYKKSKTVAVFLSRRSEVQTKAIVKDIFDSGKSCFIPKYSRLQKMNMVKINSVEEIASFVKSSFGRPGNIQPADDDVREDPLKTGGLDVMIVPGLGFTTTGRRLGRGQGYYDRIIYEYISTYPKKEFNTIGLAFKQQMCEDIPISEFDIIIDFVMSP